MSVPLTNKAEVGDRAAAGLLTFFASGSKSPTIHSANDKTPDVSVGKNKKNRSRRPEVEEDSMNIQNQKRPYKKKKCDDKKMATNAGESKPKRPLSAYNFFFQAERTDTRGCAEDVSKVIGKKWRELSEKDRLVFTNLAKMDTDRYKSEMAEVQFRSGYQNNSKKDETSDSGTSSVETKGSCPDTQQLTSSARLTNATRASQRVAEAYDERNSRPHRNEATFLESYGDIPIAPRISNNSVVLPNNLNVPCADLRLSQQPAAPAIYFPPMIRASQPIRNGTHPPTGRDNSDATSRYYRSLLEQTESFPFLTGLHPSNQTMLLSGMPLYTPVPLIEGAQLQNNGYLNMNQLLALSGVQNSEGFSIGSLPASLAPIHLPMAAQLPQRMSTHPVGVNAAALNDDLPIQDMTSLNILNALSRMSRSDVYRMAQREPLMVAPQHNENASDLILQMIHNLQSRERL